MRYKLFFTVGCPKCPKVKDFLENIDVDGDMIDAGKSEGLEEARKFAVSSVPFVIFFEDDKQIGTAQSIDEIKNFVENKRLC